MMNDASLRTVHRYMVGINCWSAATGQSVGAAPPEAAAGVASPGSATSGRSATEQALLKVAEAATVKLPTWKSSTAMSVKQVKAHIKSYAAGKRSTWNTDKLDEAVMDMRKNAQRSAAENRAAAREILAGGDDGIDFRAKRPTRLARGLATIGVHRRGGRVRDRSHRRRHTSSRSHIRSHSSRNHSSRNSRSRNSRSRSSSDDDTSPRVTR